MESEHYSLAFKYFMLTFCTCCTKKMLRVAQKTMLCEQKGYVKKILRCTPKLC